MRALSVDRYKTENGMRLGEVPEPEVGPATSSFASMRRASTRSTRRFSRATSS